MICPLCDGKHNLDECNSFKEKGLLERTRFLFEQKSCYGSFFPISASHNARNCEKRKECKNCKKRHPTSLHDYKTEKPKEKLEISYEEKGNEQKDFHCATVKISLRVINMNVVLAMGRHKLSNQVVQSYAMLNTCSQATFAEENLLCDLGMQGKQTSIIIVCTPL